MKIDINGEKVTKLVMRVVITEYMSQHLVASNNADWTPFSIPTILMSFNKIDIDLIIEIA